MNQDKYSHSLTPRGHALWIDMLAFVCAIGISCLLFLKSSLLPLAPLPLVLVATWIILPRLGARSDQVIFLGFFILAFSLDDIAFKPFGPVETITKQISVILFQSFGLTGFEVFASVFAGLCFFLTLPQQRSHWLRLRLPVLLLVASAMFLPALVASVWGVLTGGDINTMFIQIRFLYLFPIWTFIGFVVMRDLKYFNKIIYWLTLVLVLKSLQVLFVYLTNLAVLRDAEYVYEHFFSAYCVVALLNLLILLYRRPEGAFKIFSAINFSIALVVYLLNDRRTSYVGVVLSCAILLFFLPKSFMKIYGRRIYLFLFSVGLITALTWKLPAPFGLVGSLYRSFGQEAGDSGPSYRDLENANILHEVSLFPFMGMGFGKEFDEIYKMPSVAATYPRYKMIPHNMLLYAWCYGGPYTIAGLTLLLVSMIALAGRLIYDEDMVGYRYIGIISLFYFIQYFSFIFGDLGLQAGRNQLLGGLFMGGCYRLLMERKMELGKC